jgi:hypothetical protein
MKSAPISFPILRLGLFIGLAYALAGSAAAQTPGPGQVGGMGQGGAPAGEFPSDRGNVTYGQRYTPAEDFPPERIPGNKDANEDKNKNASSDSSDSSVESSSAPEKRSAGNKASSSIDPSAADKKLPAAVDTDAQRK